MVTNRPKKRCKGGGLAFIIDEDVRYRKLSLPSLPTSNNHTELRTQSKSGDWLLNLINFYIPANSSCITGFSASVKHLLDLQLSLIASDINAHNELWYSRINQDQRSATNANWSTELALGSKHILFTINITCVLENLDAEKRTYDNRNRKTVRKTDWLKIMKKKQNFFFQKTQF